MVWQPLGETLGETWFGNPLGETLGNPLRETLGEI